MKFLRTSLLFVGFITLSTFGTLALFIVPERPAGYVSDYAALLSPKAKASLETTLTAFTASTTSEIAVVTVPGLDGDTIERYANVLFNRWKIGKTKKDNGVLLLISRDDRRARIEVGYGLEGAIPDVLAAQILNEKLIPAFKVGDIDGGVIHAVDAIILATKGEYTANTKGGAPTKPFSFDALFLFAVFGIQFFVFLSSVFARSKSWWAGGVVGAGIGGLLTFFEAFGLTVSMGALITIVFATLGLIFDYIVSRTYTGAVASGSTIPWWVGGNSGGFRSSRGGSSFGGFGGGRSGGGGASSSW